MKSLYASRAICGGATIGLSLWSLVAGEEALQPIAVSLTFSTLFGYWLFNREIRRELRREMEE